MAVVGENGPAAVGPQPGLVVPAATDVQLLLDASTPTVPDPRKVDAYHKWLIFTECYGSLVSRKISAVQRDVDIRAEINRHIDLSINLGLDITKDVSVIWKSGSTRRLNRGDIITGKPEEDDSRASRSDLAFHSLVRESRFRTFAPVWNQMAFFLGPITVVPVIRGGRLTWDTLKPHEYDVVTNPDDPFGDPLAVVWDVRRRGPFTPQGKSDGQADLIILDDEAWTYYKVRGRGDVEVVGRTEHGLGMFPGSVLRFDIAHDLSWWGHDQHRRLVDATITIGYLLASLSFIRKAQNKKLLTIIGDLEAMPKGQTTGPERGLAVDTGAQGGGTVNISTIDFDTDPKNFIQHASWLMHSIARSYGGSTSIQSGGFGTIEFGHGELTEIRNSQIPFARDFEHDLWAKSTSMAIRMGHPMAKDLPDHDEVKNNLSIEFAKLSRVFTDPKDEQEYLDWRLKRGLDNYGTLGQRDWTELTEEQAQARVMDNIQKQIPVIEQVTKRDMTTNPSQQTPGLQTPAEAFGSMGPVARDQNKADEESAEPSTSE